MSVAKIRKAMGDFPNFMHFNVATKDPVRSFPVCPSAWMGALASHLRPNFAETSYKEVHNCYQAFSYKLMQVEEPGAFRPTPVRAPLLRVR